jgi:predicted enzyme related to lactoylglutathione lyase
LPDQSKIQNPKSKINMLQGLRTVVYKVRDLQRAKEWYTNALGFGPYFDEPFYVGFNVGGFELGLDPDTEGVSEGTGGVGAYWGVEDATKSYERLLELGASPHHPPQEVGEGIVVATVLDPFGNILGVICNPHFSIGKSGD